MRTTCLTCRQPFTMNPIACPDGIETCATLHFDRTSWTCPSCGHDHYEALVSALPAKAYVELHRRDQPTLGLHPAPHMATTPRFVVPEMVVGMGVGNVKSMAALELYAGAKSKPWWERALDAVWQERTDIGPADDRYMTQWTWAPSEDGWQLRLHWTHRPDYAAHAHDHPADFWSWQMWGSYTEERPIPAVLAVLHLALRSGRSRLSEALMSLFAEQMTAVPKRFSRRRWLSVIFRSAVNPHRIVAAKNSWTLVLMKPRSRRHWGFWTPEGWVQSDVYFEKYPSRADAGRES